MTKLDKAVEIVRKMSDEEIKGFILHRCPRMVGQEDECKCSGYLGADCEACWNEEVLQ